jgi:hypothetical protein
MGPRDRDNLLPSLGQQVDDVASDAAGRAGNGDLLAFGHSFLLQNKL